MRTRQKIITVVSLLLALLIVEMKHPAAVNVAVESRYQFEQPPQRVSEQRRWPPYALPRMKASNHSLLYLVAGLVSGALWFLFPLLFDGGWGIPPGSIGSVAGAFCAMVTGVLVSSLFRPAFRRAPLLAFIFLPCVTLPVAIVSFSLLLWLSRLALGVHFSPAPIGGDLRLLAESYLVYGLLGSGPLLYILALLNQYAMRSLLNRIG